MKHRVAWLFVITLSALAALSPAAMALKLDVERPGEHEFVRDLANMLTPEDKEKIRALGDKLLKEKATPIIVVTIESMAKHGGADLRLETFTRLLFDQWGIGQAKLGDTAWNTGILLLISRDDRRARIELGAGWALDKNALCQQIMDEQIIPRFKQGDFSGGIVAGVEALNQMARGLELPKPPTNWRAVMLIVGFFALMAFTIVSLIRRGSSGWAWLMWGVVFSVLGYVLYNMMTNSGRSGGGGFGGGSFGGGFSGGGGASGSW
ncbi:MAG: hypothetical protein GC162_16430 [Planctomycetes bacterium]|nr:hypothetical protein [Planctomycetota bacterium]